MSGKFPGQKTQDDFIDATSGKTYQHIYYQKIFITLTLGLLLASFGYIIISLTRVYLFQPKDRELYYQIQKSKKQAFIMLEHNEISQHEYFDYMKKIRQAQHYLDQKYPFPWTIMQLKNYRFPFIYPVFFISLYGIAFYYWKKKEKWLDKNFFYQTSVQEPPMPRPSKLVNMEYLKKNEEMFKQVFSQFNNFVEYFSTGTGGLFKPQEVIKEYKQFASLLKEDCVLGINQKEFLYFILVLLTHKHGLKYGNIPTGLIATTIKDYTLKKMLSMYYRKHLPVLLDVKGDFIDRDYKAYIYLKMYYVYNDIINRLNE